MPRQGDWLYIAEYINAFIAAALPLVYTYSCDAHTVSKTVIGLTMCIHDIVWSWLSTHRFAATVTVLCTTEIMSTAVWRTWPTDSRFWGWSLPSAVRLQSDLYYIYTCEGYKFINCLLILYRLWILNNVAVRWYYFYVCIYCNYYSYELITYYIYSRWCGVITYR